MCRSLLAAGWLLVAAARPADGGGGRRSLILGGDELGGAPHPWMVSLQHRNRHFCGGTLLDERHVLTAAHCEEHVRCTGEICEGVDINIFRHNLTQLAEDEFPGCSAVVRGAAWVSHPGFTGSPLYLHDLAVLKLAEPVDDLGRCAPYGLDTRRTQRFVDLLAQPLRDSGVRAGSPVLAVGWGRMWPDGPQSPVLLETNVRAILAAECARGWGSMVRQEQICASSGLGGELRDVCNGDSGGPLIVPGTNVQVGITSYSRRCGTPGVPSVFQDPRSPSHTAWIRRTVQCLSDPTCCPLASASDGQLTASEECDDGNNVAGDGCFCGLLEDGYLCQGEPSRCTTCGAPVPRPPSAVVCRDLDAQCPAWARRGECEANPGYMDVRCPSSCQLPGCWVDDRRRTQPVYLSIEVDAMQHPSDYSWEIAQRDGAPVRNKGSGDGFLVCCLPGEQYELHLNADRWNSSLGFTVSSGSPRRVLFEQAPWSGTTTATVFSLDGVQPEAGTAAVEVDSCITIQLHETGGAPSIVPNSPAHFGQSEFELGLTRFVFGEPRDGCAEALTNGAAVRGKVAVLFRGDCFFVHKANVAQAAGAVGLLVVNYDDAANRGLTVPMGAASDSSRSSDNPCCVSIPLAMVTAATGLALRNNPNLQVSFSAQDCYSAPSDCPLAWIGSTQPGCGACSPGQVSDCNDVCRSSYHLGDGVCDIGEDVSGSADFSCEELNYDEGDCAPQRCEDDDAWRDPLGRGCAHSSYSAVPGACGDFEESYVKCKRTCHTCPGACNALWDTVADQGTQTSCAKISYVYGVSCEEVEAAGISCAHARYCGYCSRPQALCARGWQEDCDGTCAPMIWVGDGRCDDGRSTAFDLSCQRGGWWDGGDCGTGQRLPSGCSLDGSSVRQLRGRRTRQTVSLLGGYGDQWDCRWQVSCGSSQGLWIRFREFDTEPAFDQLKIYDGQAAELQFEGCDQECQSRNRCLAKLDLDARCAQWAGRGECEANAAYMNVACAFSCAGCAPVELSSPRSVWSGAALPATTVSSGSVTLRFTSDAHLEGDGFAFEYACGAAPAEVAPCASQPCLHGAECTESRDGFWCACPFGFEGVSCDVRVVGANAVLQAGSGDDDCEQRMVGFAEHVTEACCAGRGQSCVEGVPQQCSAECAAAWIPFSRACSVFLETTFPQFHAFELLCEEQQYGPVARRCPAEFYDEGVRQVAAACCQRNRACSGGDITQLPQSCNANCAPVLEEFYLACRGFMADRTPTGFAALESLLTVCQTGH